MKKEAWDQTETWWQAGNENEPAEQIRPGPATLHLATISTEFDILFVKSQIGRWNTRLTDVEKQRKETFCGCKKPSAYMWNKTR